MSILNYQNCQIHLIKKAAPKSEREKGMPFPAFLDVERLL